MPISKRDHNHAQISIIIPTYNEAQNILKIIKSIGENLPKNILTETIVIDDNSPDGTGKVVEDYLNNVKKAAWYTINVIHRTAKKGLGSAILMGIQHARGETIIVMDSDLSHPPQIIPKMIEAIKRYQYDIVVASRYVKGGKIKGWSIKRRLMSRVATKIAKKGLRIDTKDPMSGFFAFKRKIITGLKFDAIGYKFLLEMLVKTRGVTVKEIPYTFIDRKSGSSKIGILTIYDYLRSVLRLYRYGNSLRKVEPRASIRFLSKAGRFYTVGASGFFVNYLASLLFAGEIADLWYLQANVIGITISMTTNFILNKIWTFEDRNFDLRRSIKQYFKFIGFSSLGALIQLGTVYYLVDEHQITYPLALIMAVLAAAFGNFILNKKWTFNEKLWG